MEVGGGGGGGGGALISTLIGKLVCLRTWGSDGHHVDQLPRPPMSRVLHDVGCVVPVCSF